MRRSLKKNGDGRWNGKKIEKDEKERNMRRNDGNGYGVRESRVRLGREGWDMNFKKYAV